MYIHLVRVPQYVDVVNFRWKPAKLGERPAFFPVHVDSYVIISILSYAVYAWLFVNYLCHSAHCQQWDSHSVLLFNV